jgi:hypothetical protein
MRDSEIRVGLERRWANIQDQDVVHAMYVEDAVLELPQSGERMIGVANIKAMRSAYPASLTASIQRMRGSGDFWVTELVLTYDGTPMHAVNIMEMRNGRIVHETIYFGDPFEAPAWRAQWVEQRS